MSSHASLELILLIGLQGSGKSTFYRAHFANSHLWVSKDRMKNRRHKTARQNRLLNTALVSGLSVVLDNTNPSPEVRAEAIQIGKAYGAKIIAYFFPPDIPRSLERNRVREGRERVPDVAIYLTAKKLLAPSYAEGFDEIWNVELQPEKKFLCTFKPSRAPAQDLP